MKEYTVTMKIVVGSEDSDYDYVSEFAEEFSQTIASMEVEEEDIQIVDAFVTEIETDNDDDFYEDEEDEEE